MKIGHFGGIKPGDILPVADIYESNCGETPASGWGVDINREDVGKYLVTFSEPVLAKSLHEEICAELHTEIARLKARVRELEPEQPAPRPLYRWGRPV